MTTLIIARHGNTFGPGDRVIYAGARTDLSLVEKGIEQARALGRYLKANNLIPDAVYASNLRRTIETAQIAVRETGVSNPVYNLDIFNEIDYGPDEGKTREEIIARIGGQALADWDARGIVPPGWIADPDGIIRNWLDFADQIRAHDDNETVLAVTSNGIARFAPALAGGYEAFLKTHSPKLATGNLSILEYRDSLWTVRGWNIKP